MIRFATYQDTLILINLLKQFLNETSYELAPQASLNTENLCKIIWLCLQSGCVIISEKNKEITGCILAVKQNNMWLPKYRELRELVYYVKPQYRLSITAGKLFRKFEQHAEQLLEQGDIQAYFTTRMTSTRDYDLERRGYRLTEKTYMKEQ